MNYDFDTVRSRWNTFSAKYDGMGKRMKPGFIPLFVADMDLKCPPAIVKAMHEVADHDIFGYSSPMADDRYTGGVIRWFGERYGFHIEPEWILPSGGTCSGINAAIRQFSNIGDGVIINRPVYGHFTGMIEGDCHRKAVDCHLIKDDKGVWRIDFEKLDQLCADPANRIYLLCSPANPVGRVWTREELEQVVAITKKHNVLLIVDEIHCDIVRENVKFVPVGTVTNDYSNICIFGGLGKTFNTAGLMCSNAIIPDKFLRERYKREAGMGGLSPFAIAACITAYNGECDDWVNEMNKYIDGNLKYVIDFCREKMPWVDVTMPEGTYCLWLDFGRSGLSGEEIHKRIYEDANVILQDGTVHDPNAPTCQRMCTPVARSVLVEAMERIAKVFADVK